MTNTVEVNFDGLVGPTHNYGGLSVGNLASMNNLGAASNPRAAVLQGIAKMRSLHALGLTQGVIPPHNRPSIRTLRAFGFTGTDAQILEKAWKTSPALVMNCASASNMWTANAATVSPSADTLDGKVHFTPANLGAMFHRSIEPALTGHILSTMFNDAEHFQHHAPIPYGGRMGDEGAANHGRFATTHGEKGIQLFVYGHSAFETPSDSAKFQPRQSVEASQAIVTQHGLSEDYVVFVRQSEIAVNAGAFHNDVVSVTNGTTLFYHENAFANKDKALDDIRSACENSKIEPIFIEAPEQAVRLTTAIKTYLFNSQLVNLPDGGMAIILPSESEEDTETHAFVNECIQSNSPITNALYFDLKQSMKNGGGPACLRLRVVLTEQERAAVTGHCIIDDAILGKLEEWAKLYYRDRLQPDDLSDPKLLVEAHTALDVLTSILGLGSLYEFQQ